MTPSSHACAVLLAVGLAFVPLVAQTAAPQRVQLTGLASAKQFDRFIVKFKAGSAPATNPTARQRSLDAAAGRARAKIGDADPRRRGVQPPTLLLNHVRRMSLGADVIGTTRKLDREQTRILLQQIAADPDVQYVEIDRILKPTFTPNDTNYGNLWGMFDADAGIRADKAWDLNTGAGTVVAVIDTGITSHSDLNANVLPGYDFITEVDRANDGDGRDGDASDPGNNSATSNSNWHGTHVAGTVGAVGNNAKGVIGVAWGGKIVPVRVLGVGGGATSDIADGLIWAAGGNVPGVPANANPAEVANMSLGGGGACDNTTQAAIDAAIALGTTVVVAAGNDNTDTVDHSPASCANVVTVGAVASNSDRSSFSNYGAPVDVSAPGSSILSTINTGTTVPVSEGYATYQGTSMATPHVAGTVALAQSHRVARGLSPYTPAAMETLLKSTAYPIVNGCVGMSGTGIIDARAVLDVAGGDAQVLSNGSAVTGLTATTGNVLYFVMPASALSQGLAFNTSGGSGNVDLYVQFNALPTTSVFACSSTAGGNTESCTIPTAQAGNYYVMLRAASGFSGVSLTGDLSGNRKPATSFSQSASGLSVTFTDTSTDSDGSISTRSWSFGDGSSTTTTNPVHAYNLAGRYTVKLTTTDNGSAKGCTLRAIGAHPAVQVLSKGVAATGLAANTGGELRYTFTVPANSSNLSFNTSGGNGDADLYIKFGSPPTTSDYDCGSFSPTTTESCTIDPAQTGTYHVLLYAYSTIGGVSLLGDYSVGASNNPPTANFSFGTSGLTANFTDGSTDSDGSIVSRSWTFGDGGTSTATNPSRTYASAGTYDVQLTVTDDDGATHSVTKQVTVTATSSPTLSINDVSVTEGDCGFEEPVLHGAAVGRRRGTSALQHRDSQRHGDRRQRLHGAQPEQPAHPGGTDEQGLHRVGQGRHAGRKRRDLVRQPQRRHRRHAGRRPGRRHDHRQRRRQRADAQHQRCQRHRRQ
ncbi:MAG: S8 family serine peptidase [Arenimonas sp.]